jgi:hypothetical protein
LWLAQSLIPTSERQAKKGGKETGFSYGSITISHRRAKLLKKGARREVLSVIH